jgi:hypothetical protein
MDPPSTVMMEDLPTGWGTAQYRDRKSGILKSYYYNKTTGVSSTLPPPPHYYDDDEDSDDSDTNKKSQDLRVLFPQAPPPRKPDSPEDHDIFDPRENVVRASILRERETGSEDEDSDAASPTAVQKTFDPDNMLKRDLLPKCVKAGIPGVESMNLAQLKDTVRKFFIELHLSEGTTLHESDCYVAKYQAIERKRKDTSAQKRRSKFAANAARKEKPFKVRHPSKKKSMGLKDIMTKFPDEGFYFASVEGKRVVRCSCNHKFISGPSRDQASILKHVKSTKTHIEYVKERKVSQLKEARLSSSQAEAAEEPGVVRMDLDGTRASSVPEVDQHFRFRVTRTLIAAGIPLNSLKIIRPALEDMCQKSLGSSNMLASENIQKIFLQEVDTQLEELKGKQVSLCFDATPRMGDVFALIVRYVETTAERKAISLSW